MAVALPIVDPASSDASLPSPNPEAEIGTGDVDGSAQAGIDRVDVAATEEPSDSQVHSTEARVIPIKDGNSSEPESSGSAETAGEVDTRGDKDRELQERIAHLSELGARVESEDIHFGGHTIQGTDEWIPGDKETRYTLITPDAVSGEVTKEPVDE